MQEKTLLKISLITSISGIALLFLLSAGAEKNEKPFQLAEDGSRAVVSGRIARVSSSGNLTFLSIYQSEPVGAVIIGKSHVSLEEGDYVEVRGAVENYNGKKELVIEEIRKT